MHRSVSALVFRNSDYLVHAISVHLRHSSYGLKSGAGAIQVFGALVSHGEEALCPLLKDTINELLLSLDTRQFDPLLVWEGLRMLARSCDNWVSKRTMKEAPRGVVNGVEQKDVAKGTDPGSVGLETVEKDGGKKEKMTLQAIADYFLQYHRAKEEEGEGYSHEGEDNPEEEPHYSQERQLPAVELMCVEVMRRCGHHMSHDESGIKLVVMETLLHCMKALRHDQVDTSSTVLCDMIVTCIGWCLQRTLFPEVHTVWPSLLPRLSDSSHPVVWRAWQVILCMCEVCGGFVRRRVLEKVWPLLVGTLQNLAEGSANSPSLYQ